LPRLLEAAERDEFRAAIHENYRLRGRSFPWRETEDPYAILVSEIMLQQTQTERVVPKYAAWLARFPTAEALAASTLPDAFALWSGLGYNRRARFLREACKTVAADYGGVFPRDADALDALPGIGAYTARAVSTFAFGKPEVFIETNIRSVFLFHFFSGQPPGSVHDREILPLVEQTLERGEPRVWYYALMDYGAQLKKAVRNPNRASAHYAKQSRFAGSLRQARGAILRALSANAEGGAYQPLSLRAISERESVGYERLEQAAAALAAERIIEQDEDACVIASG
jgi:A/G-specific adenine glycosylase